MTREAEKVVRGCVCESDQLDTASHVMGDSTIDNGLLQVK